MAKPFLNRLGDHYKVIVAVMLIIFGIMMRLGFYMDDSKTWRAPPGEDPVRDAPVGESSNPE